MLLRNKETGELVNPLAVGLAAIKSLDAAVSHPKYAYFYGLVQEVKYQQKEVIAQAELIANISNQVVDQLRITTATNKPCVLNKLGELQNKGPAFDVAVAIYECKVEELIRKIVELFSSHYEQA